MHYFHYFLALLFILSSSGFVVAEEVDTREGSAISILNDNDLDQLGSRASAFKKEKNYREALPIYQRILTIKEKAFSEDHAEVNKAVNNVALAHHWLKEYEEAIPLYRRILQINEKALGESHKGLIWNLNNLASCLTEIGNYNEALPLYERALKIRENEYGVDSKEVVDGLKKLGYLHKKEKNYIKALPRYQRILKIKEESLGLNHEEVGKAVNDVASTYYSLEEFDGAIGLYQRVVRVNDSEIIEKNIRNMAIKLNKKGEAYRDSSSPLKSVTYFESAYSFFALISEYGSMIVNRMSLSSAYISSGDYSKAIEYLEPFEKVLRTNRHEFPDRYVYGYYLNLGGTYISNGQYQKGIKLLRMVPEDYLLMNISERLAFYGNLSSAYARLGSQDRALEASRKSFGIVSQKNSLDERMVVTTYINHASTLIRSEIYDEAEIVIDAGIHKAEQSESTKQYVNSFRLVQSKMFRGMGSVKNTLDAARQGLKTLKAERPYAINEISDAEANLCGLNMELSRFEEAERFCLRAYLLSGLTRSIDGLAGSTFDLSFNLSHQDKNELSILLGKLAINSLQRIRFENSKLEKRVQNNYLDLIYPLYRDLIETLLNDSRVIEAERILVMMKEEEVSAFRSSAGLNNSSLTLASFTNEENNAVKILEKEILSFRLLYEEYQIAGRNISMVEKSDQANSLNSLSVKLDKKYDRLALVLDSLSGGLKKKSVPDVNTSKKGLSASRNILAKLDKTVIIQTLISDGAIYFFVSCKDDTRVIKKDIRTTTLNQKVIDFRQALQNRDHDIAKISHEMYEILFDPIERVVRELAPNVIAWSLDGPLRYIPVAALFDGEQYLVERYQNVIYTPAAKIQTQKHHEEKSRVAAFGVSQESLVKLGDKGDESFIRFGALPNVSLELDQIVKESEIDYLGTTPGLVKLDEYFTETELEKAIGSNKYGGIHLATHFNLKPGNDSDSFLLLGNNKFLPLKDFGANTKFKMGEVDLFTLSACETGISGEGGEVESFSVMVQEQGASAVLSSLWKVDDKSTQLLMGEFYSSRMKGRASKAMSLNKAQLLILREDAKFKHPYYWAPFVLMGNWL